MGKIIEFNHPGKQFEFKKDCHGFKWCGCDCKQGIRFWNEETHYRKFIKNHGSYLKNLSSTPEEGELYFWGEWEPQSKFESINCNYEKNDRQPNAVHYELFIDNNFSCNNNNFLNNTDPFVFGNDFYYSNCRQKGKKGKLLNLRAGDMILFGTNYYKKEEGFALDTVFIVENSIDVRAYLDNKSLYPNVLRQATLDLVYKQDTDFKLYKAQMYDIKNPYNMKGKMFSFFPCKVENGESTVCSERPLIKYNDNGEFNLKNIRGFKEIQDDGNVFDYWKRLTEYLFNKGYLLGIQTDMPKSITCQNIKC